MEANKMSLTLLCFSIPLLLFGFGINTPLG
jgi:hypothetical protein